MLQGLEHWTTSSINHQIPSWNYENYQGENYYFQKNRIGMTNDENTFHSASRASPQAEGTFSFKFLNPNTEYEVKIRARNKHGWSQEGPWGQVLECYCFTEQVEC